MYPYSLSNDNNSGGYYYGYCNNMQSSCPSYKSPQYQQLTPGKKYNKYQTFIDVFDTEEVEYLLNSEIALIKHKIDNEDYEIAATLIFDMINVIYAIREDRKKSLSLSYDPVRCSANLDSYVCSLEERCNMYSSQLTELIDIAKCDKFKLNGEEESDCDEVDE